MEEPVVFREGLHKKGGMNADPDPNYTPPKPQSFVGEEAQDVKNVPLAWGRYNEAKAELARIVALKAEAAKRVDEALSALVEATMKDANHD